MVDDPWSVRYHCTQWFCFVSPFVELSLVVSRCRIFVAVSVDNVYAVNYYWTSCPSCAPLCLGWWLCSPKFYSPKFWVGPWGCAARFSKPWPYFRPKYIIFHTPFQTWPRKSVPINLNHTGSNEIGWLLPGSLGSPEFGTGTTSAVFHAPAKMLELKEPLMMVRAIQTDLQVKILR